MYSLTIATPTSGWEGFFIQANFPGPDGTALELTTETQIIPDTYPTNDCYGDGCIGTLVWLSHPMDECEVASVWELTVLLINTLFSWGYLDGKNKVTSLSVRVKRSLENYTLRQLDASLVLASFTRKSRQQRKAFCLTFYFCMSSDLQFWSCVNEDRCSIAFSSISWHQQICHLRKPRRVKKLR